VKGKHPTVSQMTGIFRTIALELGRTLLKLAVDRALRRELPAIFAKLDMELPFLLINSAKPLEVQAVVTDIIEEKIGRTATATQISTVLSLYDPVKAAIRNLIKR
jgi:hypothetical protein